MSKHASISLKIIGTTHHAAFESGIGAAILVMGYLEVFICDW